MIMNVYRKFVWAMFIVPLLLTGNALAADKKAPSGTIVIDETQVMALLGGDMGGGTLLLGGQSYNFKTKGLKIGGVGIHKINLVGQVYHLNDVADFPGDYFEAEIDVTLFDADKGGFWLKNSKGVTLHLKSSKGEGIALDTGAEGFKVTME
jgi:hypothetical protein